MAKSIKAIQCPQCGSTDQHELRPDFYQCRSCKTEYFLDSDDVHHYHHHQRVGPVQSSAPPGNNKLPLFILTGAILVIVVIYLVVASVQPAKHKYAGTVSTYKMPRMYYDSFVYTNTATGDPIYLRLGTDQIDKGNNKTVQEVHAQFNSALNGELLADKIVTDEVLSTKRCALTFKTYAPDKVYAIGCNEILLQLDTRNNQLLNITQRTFKDFSELSSGVAKVDFDYYKPMINIMNNEGRSYYYFPEKQQLIADTEEAERFWKAEYDRHYFEFGYLGDVFDSNKYNQLIENRYNKQTGKLMQRDLTPGRKYFDPKILYQDDNNLLLVVNTTAAPNPPVSIQSIDVKTGKIKWALAPDEYDLYSATKCKQGFAVEYRKDERADYVHGVLVIADNGKLLNNYQLARTE